MQLIQGVKGLLGKSGAPPPTFSPPLGAPTWQPPAMEMFRPQLQDPYHGGAQWLPYVQQVAMQFGNSWIPQQTQGLAGIDLSGVWCALGNPMDQSYVRQCGPYLWFVEGIMGTVTAVGEGLFNPVNRVVCIRGLNAYGAVFDGRYQLLPNWTMQGMVTAPGPMGFPLQTPSVAVKIA